MKKIFACLLIASAAIWAFTACESEEDFLTEKPKSQFSIDNAYGTSAQVLSTVVAAYAEVQNQNFGRFQAIQSDELSVFSVFGAQTSNIPTWNNTGTWSGTGSEGHNAKNVWDSMYKIIAFANQALYACGLESINWSSAAEKASLVSEARFLRGYAYLRLGECFGGVPIVSEYSEELHQDYVRETRANTYNFAIEDLKDAYNNLPAKPVKGRAGKGAAALLLAEAYLALGVADGSNHTSDAANYAQACIDLHPLMTKRFGMRADPNDTGSNLGVPNYNPDGTPYSDLFYKTNPRLDENTEAVWLLLGARSYSEQQANSGVLRVMSHRNFAPANRDVRALTAEYQQGSGEKPWADGKFYDIYNTWNGKKTAIPAITANGVPFAGVPSWFAAVQVWDAEHNKVEGKDDRAKEGVAIRRNYPITNPDHPYFSKCVHKNWGTDETWLGWEAIDKTNMATAMEYSAVFDKRTPIDAWGYDENTYFSASVFGANIFRDWYMLRSADAYLLLAEAKFRGGDAAGAAAAINAVRARANAEPFTAGEITLQVILDERCRELMHEENRWATLLRFEPNIWKDRIYSYGTWTYVRSKSTLNKNAKLFPDTMQFEDTNTDLKWDLWPIPQVYVDLNIDNPEGMAQNPGWN